MPVPSMIQATVNRMPGIAASIASVPELPKNDFTPPGKIVPELSERTDWAIRRAMSADPEQRPASCREFAEDLLGASDDIEPVMDNCDTHLGSHFPE